VKGGQIVGDESDFAEFKKFWNCLTIATLLKIYVSRY